MKLDIKLLYLYLFSFIGLVSIVTGGVKIIELGLRTYIFTQSDYTEYPRPDAYSQVDEARQMAFTKRNSIADKQRDAANAIATIVVGVPLYSYHWRKIKKLKN